SLSPWWNAANCSAYVSGEAGLRNPITGTVGCCAHAASGHTAAALPSSVMKSRRFTAVLPVLPTESVAQPYCAAGFQFGPCQPRVICDRAWQIHTSMHVCFALKPDN